MIMSQAPIQLPGKNNLKIFFQFLCISPFIPFTGTVPFFKGSKEGSIMYAKVCGRYFYTLKCPNIFPGKCKLLYFFSSFQAPPIGPINEIAHINCWFAVAFFLFPPGVSLPSVPAHVSRRAMCVSRGHWAFYNVKLNSILLRHASS